MIVTVLGQAHFLLPGISPYGGINGIATHDARTVIAVVTIDDGAGGGMGGRSLAELAVIAAGIFAAGFCVGYFIRAMISRRRRRHYSGRLQ
jgi:hypothetical protein